MEIISEGEPAGCREYCMFSTTGKCFVVGEATGKSKESGYVHGVFKRDAQTSAALISRLTGVYELCEQKTAARAALNALIQRHNTDFPELQIDALEG